MDLSVVVPVFNEAENLAILQEEIEDALDKTGFDYEVIYVDDASIDHSAKILKSLAEAYPKVKVVSFARHFGQSEALLAGFKKSRGKWILTLDADGQNPPKEIFQLIPFCQTYDFITGIRQNRQDSFSKKAGSSIAKICRKLVLGDTTADTGCSLRLFKREAIEAMPAVRNFHRFFTFLAKLEGFKIQEVYVQHRSRQFGRSKYGNLRRLWQGGFDLWNVYRLKKRMMKDEVKHQR